MVLEKKEIQIPFVVGIDDRADPIISSGGMSDIRNATFDRFGQIQKCTGYEQRTNSFKYLGNTCKPIYGNLIAPSYSGSTFICADPSVSGSTDESVVRRGIYENIQGSSSDYCSYVGKYNPVEIVKKFAFSVSDTSCKSVYSIYINACDVYGDGKDTICAVVSFNTDSAGTSSTKKVYYYVFREDGGKIFSGTLGSLSVSFAHPKIVMAIDSMWILHESTCGTISCSTINTTAGTVVRQDLITGITSASVIGNKQFWDVYEVRSAYGVNPGQGFYITYSTGPVTSTVVVRYKKYDYSGTAPVASATVGTVTSGNGHLSAMFLKDPITTGRSYIVATMRSGATKTTVNVLQYRIDNASSAKTKASMPTGCTSCQGLLVFGNDLTAATGSNPNFIGLFSTIYTSSVGTVGSYERVYSYGYNIGTNTATVGDAIGDVRIFGKIKDDLAYSNGSISRDIVKFGDSSLVITNGGSYTGSDSFQGSLFFTDLSITTGELNFSTYAKVADGTYFGPSAYVHDFGGTKYIPVVTYSDDSSFVVSVYKHDSHRYSSYGKSATPFKNKSKELGENATFLGVGNITRVCSTEIAEIGFGAYPVITTVTTGSYGAGTTVGVGTYTIRAVFEHINAFGEVDYSAYSEDLTDNSVAVTTGNGIRIGVACCPFGTASKMANSKITVYLKKSTDSTFHRQSAYVLGIGGSTRSTITLSGAYDDDGADLYSEDGTPESFQPPSGVCHLSDSGRMFVVPYDANGRVYFSRKKQSGLSYQFCSDPFSVQIPESGGYPVACSSFGGITYIFCKNSVYYVTGDGPDDTGVGGFFQPSKLCDIQTSYARDVGICGAGILLRSSSGRMYTISGTTVTPFGEEIENADTITSLASLLYLKDTQELFVVSAHSSIYSFVFHEGVKQWTKNHMLYSIMDSCVSNGRLMLLRSCSATGYGPWFGYGGDDGINPTYIYSYPTTAAAGTVAYGLLLKTAWINLDSVEGFGRLYDIKLVANKITTAGTTNPYAVTIYYDYSDSGTYKSCTITPSDSTKYEYVIKLNRQCSAVRVQISETATDKNASGFQFIAMQFVVGVKPKKKLPNTNTLKIS